MSKHTPGPWAIDMVGDSSYISGANHSWIVKMMPCRPTIGHDARLIASAPELLEALQACLDYGSMTGDEWVTDKAIAAIAKANGGEA